MFIMGNPIQFRGTPILGNLHSMLWITSPDHRASHEQLHLLGLQLHPNGHHLRREQGEAPEVAVPRRTGGILHKGLAAKVGEWEATPSDSPWFIGTILIKKQTPIHFVYFCLVFSSVPMYSPDFPPPTKSGPISSKIQPCHIAPVATASRAAPALWRRAAAPPGVGTDRARHWHWWSPGPRAAPPAGRAPSSPPQKSCDVDEVLA